MNLIQFAIQQALCCLFPAAIFLTLAFTRYLDIPGIPRYDFILLICIAVQIVMLLTRLESWDEFKVIGLFHVIGLMLELYKVHMGSWSYPESAWTKIFGVPLYSGFMYASVASYLCQAWRRFELRFIAWPRPIYTFPLAILIYLNFFTHHYIWDFRYGLILVIFLVFWQSKVRFRVQDQLYHMPIVLSFVLIGFFIWIAENISTFLGAWAYPDQLLSWQIVHVGKISSWYLLVIISVILVANLKNIKYRT